MTLAPPIIYNVPLGFVVTIPTIANSSNAFDSHLSIPSGYDSVEYQVKYSTDDSLYTDWQPLSIAYSYTNYAYSHTGLLQNVYYSYRYRIHYVSGGYSDWSEVENPGRGDLFNSNSIDQIASSLGTFTSGILRGVIFETSANPPKVRMDPGGFYSIGTTSTPIYINAQDGSITSTDSLGNVALYISPVAGGANFSGTIFASGGIYQNLASTPIQAASPIVQSKFKWLDPTTAQETVSLYGVNQGYAGKTAVGSLMSGAQVGQGYRQRVLATSPTAYWKMKYDSAHGQINNEIDAVNVLYPFTSGSGSITANGTNLVVGQTDGSSLFSSISGTFGNAYTYSNKPLDLRPPFALDLWINLANYNSLGGQTALVWSSDLRNPNGINATGFYLYLYAPRNTLQLAYDQAGIDAPGDLGVDVTLVTFTSRPTGTYYISIVATNSSVKAYVNNILVMDSPRGILSNAAKYVYSGSGIWAGTICYIDELAYYRATPGQLPLATPDISDHYTTGTTGASSTTAIKEVTIYDTDGNSDFLNLASTKVRNSSTQGTSDSSLLTLAFTSEDWDKNNMHDNVTNNTRLTCNVAGIYNIGAMVEWATGGGTLREVRMLVNGTLINDADNVIPPVSGNVTRQSVNTLAQLAVGDYVETQVFQVGGGSLNVNKAIMWATFESS